ncbi:MAG: MFS transporter [Halolamina sp.]|uniref:MFS transporter n=1 Tax=Halolamina sp. TaxID=1940283 RepID=UPI002FC3723A
MSNTIQNQLRRTVADLHGDGRGWSIVAVAVGWFLVVGTMLTVPAVLPNIKAEFALSNTGAGIAVTVMWLVYGVCQFPAGLLTDKVGERWMLVASMALGGLTAASFAVSPSFLAFVVSGGLFGIVGGLFATPRVTLLSREFPESSGTAIGLVMAMGNIGAALLPAAVGVIAAAIGWRFGFGMAIPIFAVAFLALWIAIPGGTTGADEDRQSVRELLPRVLVQLRTREILLVTAGVTLTFFTFQGMTAFLTTYLISVKGIAGSTAALLYGGLFAVAAVMQPIAGRLSDETNERVVLIAITGVYVLLLVALVLSGRFVFLAAAVVLLGTQRGATPVATAYLAAALPEEIRGGGYGLLRTVFTGVSSMGAVVVGLFADAELFDAAFLLLAVLAALATGCYVLLPAPSNA